MRNGSLRLEATFNSKFLDYNFVVLNAHFEFADGSTLSVSNSGKNYGYRHNINNYGGDSANLTRNGSKIIWTGTGLGAIGSYPLGSITVLFYK